VISGDYSRHAAECRGDGESGNGNKKYFFRSNRVASHPVNGIVTAAATIEDVSTRIILSGFELHDKKLQK